MIKDILEKNLLIFGQKKINIKFGDVEIAAAQAMEKLGQIPKGVSSTVRKKAKINVKEFIRLKTKLNMT